MRLTTADLRLHMAKKERRTSERYGAKILAEVYSAQTSILLGRAVIFNISYGGAGIETNVILNEGDKVVLKFHLKKHKYDFSRLIIKGEVEVRWGSLKGRKKFYGVRFFKVSAEDRSRIKDYIEFLEKRIRVKR
ncbi:MAG: PilZ domain-containing protein [Elusimicrobiota bacterium]